MGIAYAQQKQVYAQFRCDTSAHFRADLDAILESVGWTNKTVVSNGFKYTLFSPQGLTCKVLIKDEGATVGVLGYKAITFQFLSADETTFSRKYYLIYDHPDYNLIGYQVIAGYCQFFISLPGISSGGWIAAYAHSFAGGIPRIPEPTLVDCTAEMPGAISQTWWCCSSGVETFGPEPNIRFNLWCRHYYSYSLNGTASDGPGGENAQSQSLQLYTFKPTNNTEIGLVPLTVYYSNGTPLDIDPFVGWGSFIRGQIWDGFIRTAARAIDGVITTIEIDANGNQVNVVWKCYGSEAYGSLYLRIEDFVPAIPIGSNYAY